MKARTLFRVGVYNHPIENALSRFRLPMERESSQPESRPKYFFIRRKPDSLYVQVSQYTNPADTRPFEYNVSLMVASLSNQTNREIADKFERETGISLKLKVPGELERAGKIISRAIDMS